MGLNEELRKLDKLVRGNKIRLIQEVLNSINISINLKFSLPFARGNRCEGISKVAGNIVEIWNDFYYSALRPIITDIDFCDLIDAYFNVRLDVISERDCYAKYSVFKINALLNFNENCKRHLHILASRTDEIESTPEKRSLENAISKIYIITKKMLVCLTGAAERFLRGIEYGFIYREVSLVSARNIWVGRNWDLAVIWHLPELSRDKEICSIGKDCACELSAIEKVDDDSPSYTADSRDRLINYSTLSNFSYSTNEISS